MQPWLHSGTVRDMSDADGWVLLAHRMPREPSGPRVTVWRRLRRLGAIQIVDGLVALPASSQNREQLDWIADEIGDAGGEAWTWTARPGSKDQQRALVARMRNEAVEQHRTVLEEAEQLLATSDRPNRRTANRLRGELRRLEAVAALTGRTQERSRRVADQLAGAAATAKTVR
jgi:hypothetical protein